jgi:hypothetical protein
MCDVLMQESNNQTNYEKYKDRIRNYYKKKVQCECGAIVSQACIYQHKQNNKHILRILSQKNEEVNSPEYILCNCGNLYTINNKKQHEKSKKHLEWLKKLEFINGH